MTNDVPVTEVAAGEHSQATASATSNPLARAPEYFT